jgi:hypothetical protein
MTTATEVRTRFIESVAIAAGLTALLLMLIGTYLDTPLRTYGPQRWAVDTSDDGIAALALIIAFAVIGTAVVFGVVVPRGLRITPERTATRSLVVAVVGVVSLVVFWAGLPTILAAGSAVLAANARARLGRTPVSAFVALVLAALTVAAAIWISISG